MYKLAWQTGLKTTYYLRSLGATNAEKSTLDKTRGVNAVAIESGAGSAAPADIKGAAGSRGRTPWWPAWPGKPSSRTRPPARQGLPQWKSSMKMRIRPRWPVPSSNGEECEACQ